MPRARQTEAGNQRRLTQLQCTTGRGVLRRRSGWNVVGIFAVLILLRTGSVRSTLVDARLSERRDRKRLASKISSQLLARRFFVVVHCAFDMRG